MNNPTQTNETLMSLAAKLTKAQRRAVLGAEEIVRGEMNVNCSDEMWDALANVGVMSWLSDSLTPLGLALRDHLARAHSERTGCEQ